MIELLIGGALVAGGQLTGAVLRRLKGPKPYRPPPEPEPVCGCGHHYALHNTDGSACHATTRVLVERGKPRTVGTGWAGEQHKVVYDHEKYGTAQCPCKRYIGPEPMPTMIHL